METLEGSAVARNISQQKSSSSKSSSAASSRPSVSPEVNRKRPHFFFLLQTKKQINKSPIIQVSCPIFEKLKIQLPRKSMQPFLSEWNVFGWAGLLIFTTSLHFLRLLRLLLKVAAATMGRSHGRGRSGRQGHRGRVRYEVTTATTAT